MEFGRNDEYAFQANESIRGRSAAEFQNNGEFSRTHTKPSQHHGKIKEDERSKIQLKKALGKMLQFAALPQTR